MQKTVKYQNNRVNNLIERSLKETNSIDVKKSNLQQFETLFFSQN